MLGTPLIATLVFAGVMIVAIFAALSARSVSRGLMRLLRRAGRMTSRAAAPAKSGAQAGVGAVPYSAMAQVIGFKSLAEAMLGDIPPALRKSVQRQGRIFRSANANQAVDTLDGSLSLEEAKRNLESARQYYEEPMGNNVSPGFLYEDSEEALIIRILKDVDLTFFYVTRRINRNISRNVLKIIAILTALVLIFPFAAGAVTLIPTVEPAFGYTLYGLVLVGFAALMALFKLFYNNATRTNGQHFNHFVQTYFGRLLNQHKTAATAFANTLNDRSADLEVIEVDANVWFLNLNWLSARQWFLDLYVRNMIFQIARNLWLSYLTVPAYFLLAGAIYAALYTVAHRFSVLEPYFWAPDWTSWKVFGPWLLLLAFYFWSLGGLLREFWREITARGWLGFQTMDVKAMIEKNIGPIVREVVDRRRDPMGRRGYPN